MVHLEESWIEHVLILSGDQLYRMDFREMLATHDRTGADVTISAVPVPEVMGFCDDTAVNDAPFYVMRFVEGHVLRDQPSAVAVLDEPACEQAAAAEAVAAVRVAHQLAHRHHPRVDLVALTTSITQGSSFTDNRNPCPRNP